MTTMKVLAQAPIWLVSMLGVVDWWFFFSSRRRHTRFDCDWSSDVCSSDLARCDQGSYCQTMLASEQMKPVATRCMASQSEFCKRYQTMDGFLKANGDEEAAKIDRKSVV